MKRKLSIIEQMTDVHILFSVTLEGILSPEQLRSALLRVQRKHPALRALIRQQADRLCYESDCAPEIPLSFIPRGSDEDCRREIQANLTTVSAEDQPQLRVVCLQSERASDLLFIATHRICDGMSILTIVREVLGALHNEDELVPYAAISTQDIIGDYQPLQPWKNNLAARLMNGLLRLVPSSNRAPANREHRLEWRAGRTVSNALKQRCKAEGVSVHAALTATLERAFFAVFGKKMFPRWILSTIDLRRGRFAAMRSDTVFSGAGNFKIYTRAPEMEFWARARVINTEIHAEAEREIHDIPKRFYFLEKLRPLSGGQVRFLVQLLDFIMRMGDMWGYNGGWSGFGFSNLGNIAIGDVNSSLCVKDLSFYMHSFNCRIFGLISYSFNGEMHFYYIADEKWIRRCPAEALKREFMDVLEHAIFKSEESVTDLSLMPVAVGE